MTAPCTLKTGWRTVKFGDVVRDVRNTTKDPESDGLERVVGLEHLDPESLALRRWDNLADLHEGTSFTRTFKAGQLLFGKRRAYQRKVAVPDFDGICSSDILVFEPSTPDLLPEFLPFLVQSDGFFDHALGTSAGSLSPRTKWQELAKYEFALPPLEEQEQIVAALTSLDELAEENRRVGAAQRLLLRAALAEMKSEVGNFEMTCLGDAVELQPGRQRSPKYEAGVRPRPYLRAANLRLGGIDLADIFRMDFSEDEEDRFAVAPGDVLLVEGGDADKVGAPAYVPEDVPRPMCIQNTVIRARVKPDGKLSQRFLYWTLRCSFHSGDFERIATGTKLYHLGLRKLAPFHIPVPPIKIQLDFAQRLDAIDQLGAELAVTCGSSRRMHVALREQLIRGEA